MASAACQWTIILTTLFVGVVFIGCGLFTAFCGNSTINGMIKKTLPITSSPDSKTYENWREIPLPINNHFFVFNITNIEEVLALTANPNVEEVGPFVFVERREKVNISWSDDETSANYVQIRTWTFDESRSVGSLDSEVFHLNVPLVSAAAFVKSQPAEGQDFFYYAINDMIRLSNATVFQSHSVRELLFEGYSDPLIDEASQMFPAMSKYDKFGWFYKRNGTASDGNYEIFTGLDDLKMLGRMKSWNNASELDFYSGKCNLLNTSSAGDFQPPFPRAVPSSVELFVGDICRSLKLNYVEPVDLLGVDGHRYAADATLFDYRVKDNQCYCPVDNGCPANGVANVSQCVMNSPAAVSLPHFLYGNQTYRDKVTGLNPDPEKHGFHLDVFKELGVAMNIRVGMQINVVVERDERIDVLANMTQSEIYYPMIWFYATAQLDESMASQMKWLQRIPAIMIATAVLLNVVGAALVIGICFCKRKVIFPNRY